MIDPFEAAWEIHLFLGEHKIPYAVIGGLAVQYWGDPRFTRDVDITVLLPIGEQEFYDMLADRFSFRVSNPSEFARQTRMVLLRASNGFEIDVSLGIPGYEEEVMRRAVDYEVEPGKFVKLCSAEDLVIHKAVAARPRDIEDIEGVVYRQGDKLDVSYIRLWLQQFADALDKSDLSAAFERMRREYQNRH